MVEGREGGRKREGMKKRGRKVRTKREEEGGKQGRSKEDGSEGRKGSLRYVINISSICPSIHKWLMCVYSCAETGN